MIKRFIKAIKWIIEDIKIQRDFKKNAIKVCLTADEVEECTKGKNYQCNYVRQLDLEQYAYQKYLKTQEKPESIAIQFYKNYIFGDPGNGETPDIETIADDSDEEALKYFRKKLAIPSKIPTDEEAKKAKGYN